MFLGKYPIENFMSGSPDQLCINLKDYWTTIRFNLKCDYRKDITVSSVLDLREEKENLIPLFKQLYKDTRKYYLERGLDVDGLLEPDNPHLKVSYYLRNVTMQGYFKGYRGNHMEKLKDFYTETEKFIEKNFGTVEEDIMPGNSVGNPNASHKTCTIREGLWVLMDSPNYELANINIQVNSDENTDHESLEEIADQLTQFSLERYPDIMQDIHGPTLQIIQKTDSFQIYLNQLVDYLESTKEHIGSLAEHRS